MHRAAWGPAPRPGHGQGGKEEGALGGPACEQAKASRPPRGGCGHHRQQRQQQQDQRVASTPCVRMGRDPRTLHEYKKYKMAVDTKWQWGTPSSLRLLGPLV